MEFRNDQRRSGKAFAETRVTSMGEIDPASITAFLDQRRVAKDPDYRQLIHGRIATLRVKASSDLNALHEYWEAERKTWRKLDDDSMRRRRDAEAWLEAISYVVANPDSEGRSPPGGGGVAGVPREPNPENMTPAEASEYLGISQSTLYKWTSGNKVPYRKIGGKKLSFTKSELDKFMASRKVATHDELEDLAQQRIDDLKLRKSLGGSRRKGDRSSGT